VCLLNLFHLSLGVHSGLALDIPNSAGYSRSIEGIVSYSYEQQPMLTLAYRPVSTNLLRLAIASTLTGTLPLRIILGCRSIQLAVRGQKKADSCVLNLVRFSLDVHYLIFRRCHEFSWLQ
jgi:hypothetical protein